MSAILYPSNYKGMIVSHDIYGNEYSVSVDELKWRPAAYAVIIHNKKVLLINIEGGYHMPGGGIELGETPEEAIIREVGEEANIKVDSPRLIGSLTTFFTKLNKNTTKKPVHVQSLLLYYACKLSDSSIREGDFLDNREVEAGLVAEWVGIDKIRNLKIGSTVDWRPIIQSTLAQS
jgi:8-oxo-dGTP diphosphatase